MTLRPYQERFINNIAARLVNAKRVVAQLATGGGKTVCFAAICERFTQRNSTDILILVHREELLKQASRAIPLPTQPVVAGMRTIPAARVYVAMVETAYKRLDKFSNIGLVIVDECHIGNFTKVIEHFKDQYIIGFTATPLAARKSYPLKDCFNDIVCGIDIPELIEQGYLCPEMTFSASQIVDRAKLKMKAGEFDQAQMAAAYKNPQYIQTTLNAYRQHALGSKTIIFNCNVEHSQAVNAAFLEAGFNSRHLDADSPDRAEILQWFANTPDAILNNIGIATTGFDQPDIETVIVNKATASMPLWLQMCGRGARPFAGKLAFTIIDLGANCTTHGLWSSPRDWERIFTNPKKPGDGVAPVKECPECNSLLHAAVRMCPPPCGYVFPIIKPKDEAIDKFVQVSKAIDVQKIIDKHQHSKLYRSLYVLIETGFMRMKRISNEHDDKILENIYDLARSWCKLNSKRFDQFHRTFVDKKFKELTHEHITLQQHLRQSGHGHSDNILPGIHPHW